MMLKTIQNKIEVTYHQSEADLNNVVIFNTVSSSVFQNIKKYCYSDEAYVEMTKHNVDIPIVIFFFIILHIRWVIYIFICIPNSVLRSGTYFL